MPAKKKAKKRTPQQAGAYARRSGHDWERFVVRMWKERFEDREWAEKVRRTDQGHRAHLCDVHGVPGLWQEAGKQSAAKPRAKMDQALRDKEKAGYSECIPVAVLRPKRGTYEAWLRLSDVAALLERMKELNVVPSENVLVRFELADFMDIYDLAEIDDGLRPTPKLKGEE